jgi:hypothetical protein
MIITIIVLSVLLCVAAFVIYNLLTKVEQFQEANEYNFEFIIGVYNSMQNAYLRMKKIDKLGSFESDDETGFIFEEIKLAMIVLNEEYSLDNELEISDNDN